MVYDKWHCIRMSARLLVGASTTPLSGPKARTVIGGNDDQCFIVDALRLQAIDEIPDEAIRETDLQEMLLLQNERFSRDRS